MVIIPPILRRIILKQFVETRAVSEANAVYLSELGISDTPVLSALVRQGKIIKTENNKYYLDKSKVRFLLL